MQDSGLLMFQRRCVRQRDGEGGSMTGRDRFNAWVSRQYEQLKKLKARFSERSKVWAFRTAEAVLAGGIIFVLVRAKR
eukprot:762455-Hanusia_phi.AAC.4